MNLILYIKELLGHFDIQPTERHLHVSKRELVHVVNLLYDLLLEECVGVAQTLTGCNAGIFTQMKY